MGIVRIEGYMYIGTFSKNFHNNFTKERLKLEFFDNESLLMILYEEMVEN